MCHRKLNDGVVVVLGHAVMGEQGVQEANEHTFPRGPRVEDQRDRCVVTYPHHLEWPIRNSRILLRRNVFSPMVLSLVMTF